MASLDQALDELDFAIMALLQYDARMSYTQVAGRLNTSVGTVRNRLTRLVDDGVVRFICRVDAKRIGFSTPTNIKVSVRPTDLIEEAVSQILQFPEVYYLALLAGDYNLDLDVMYRNQEHLNELITQRLYKVKGVQSVFTSVVLRIYKSSIPDFTVFTSEITAP